MVCLVHPLGHDDSNDSICVVYMSIQLFIFSATSTTIILIFKSPKCTNEGVVGPVEND